MQWMEKSYNTVGEGMFELCNASYSIAQAMDLEKVCHCESCICNIGLKELDERDKEREKKIKNLNFKSLEELIHEAASWDFDADEYCPYDNGFDDGVDGKGNRYLLYYTCNDLRFVVTERKHDYLFKVVPPNGYFRKGSTLKESLLQCGYAVNGD